MGFFKGTAFSFLLVLSLIFISACDPIPTRKLNTSEKEVEMKWIFNKIDTEYAPLDYKINAGILDLKSRGFTQDFFGYEKLKELYLAKALQTKNNQELIELVQEFIAEFKDAHTAITFRGSNTFENVKVSYLGFSGIRVGDGFMVTDIHPSIAAYYGSYFPIRKGDIISHFNGKSLKDVVLEDMVKFRNLGNNLSNMTYHMNGIFNRYSLANGTVNEPEAMVTVKSFDDEGNLVTSDVKLHWISTSLKDYSLDRRLIEQASTRPVSKLVLKDHFDKMRPFSIEFVDFNGAPLTLNADVLAKKHFKKKALKFLEDFRFTPDPFAARWITRENASVDAIHEQEKPLAGFEKLAQERRIPSNAVAIEEAKTFPAYIRPVSVKLPNGESAIKFMGYLRVDTFSPFQSEEIVMEELKATLQRFRDFGVEGIVLDMLNNGGGSVSLVYQMAHLFSNEHIQDHTINLGVNETWFQNTARGRDLAPTPPEKYIQGEMHEVLKKDREQGLRLSSVDFPINRLVNYLNPNRSLKKKFNIVLLVNEMCASAADIMTSMMKENNLALVLGSQTMGAGGNVHQNLAEQTPNLHGKVTVTHSLIKNTEKVFIETNGPKPHVSIDTSVFAPGRYSSLINGIATELALNKEKAEKLQKEGALKTELRLVRTPLLSSCAQKLTPKNTEVDRPFQWDVVVTEE